MRLKHVVAALIVTVGAVTRGEAQKYMSRAPKPAK
jgi:hypothetical protein